MCVWLIGNQAVRGTQILAKDQAFVARGQGGAGTAGGGGYYSTPSGGQGEVSWQLAKEWYRQITEQFSKPYHSFMARQTKEREELYTWRGSPRDLIP